jgi:hypothetical protein
MTGALPKGEITMYRNSLLFAALALPFSPVFGQDSPGGIQNLSSLPLSFEPNAGQADTDVRFLARAPGMIVYFTDDGIAMSLHRRDRNAGRNAPTARAMVKMKLAGARPPLEVRGLDAQPGVSHYFIGDDPKGWRTNVPHYGRVSLTSVYDGIDLVSYGNQRTLEYDFVVAPGADPNQVQLAFEGADSIEVNGDGDLLLHTAIGDVIQKRPRVYQNSAGGQVNVAARYSITRGRRVSFELASYDRRKPLVIDPVVSYATLLSGSAVEQANGVAIDNAGAAYITGTTDSTANTAPLNQFPHTSSNQPNYSDDAFVTKISADGSTLIYTTFIGGAQNDRAFAIAVDQTGAAYITGDTNTNNNGHTLGNPANFPILAPLQSTFGGGQWDAFVAKLSPSGTLVYSTYLGGSGDESGLGIAVDSAGSAYVTGETSSTNFNVTPGALNTQFNLGVNPGVLVTDAFVTKIGPSGQLVYSTFLGGSGSDHGQGIAVDASGSVYVTGTTFSWDFPPQSSTQMCLAKASSSDAFVTKLDPTGTTKVYSTCLGGASSDQGLAIAIDSLGAAYVTGSTMSAMPSPFPTTAGAFQTSLAGNQDAFITKFTPSGTIAYSSYLGGSAADVGNGIGVDSTGAAYVAGSTASIDMKGPGGVALSNAGGVDAFVANINPSGTALVYLVSRGGTGVDQANAIAVDVLGAAFVVGFTESTFPTTTGAVQTKGNGSPGDDDAFVFKLSGSLTPVGAKLYSPGPAPSIKLPFKSIPQLTFAWNPVSAAVSYRLDVGVSCGGTDFYSQNVGLATSETVVVALGSVCARLTTNFDTYSVHYDYRWNVMENPYIR